MEQTATRVSALMKALSHRDRLMVLCHLSQGEMAAGELAEALEKKAPAMSQQLSVLRSEKIIEARRQGQSIYYRIIDDDAVAVMGFLYERFCSDDADQSIELDPTGERESA